MAPSELLERRGGYNWERDPRKYRKQEEGTVAPPCLTISRAPQRRGRDGFLVRGARARDDGHFKAQGPVLFGTCQVPTHFWL